MTVKQTILLVIVTFVAGAGLGYFQKPSKVVEKEKVVYLDRFIEKKDTTKKNNKVYVKFVTVKPDGTRTEETKIIDQGSTVTIDNKDSSVSVVTEKEKIVENSKDTLILSLGAKTALSTNPIPSYGVTVNKRLIGPFWLGAFAFSDSSFGGSVGIGF